MKPQTVQPLIFAAKDTRIPANASAYLFGEYAEALGWCKTMHGRTFKLTAPKQMNSALTLDQLIDAANGDFPRGHACGANLCRNAITEMAGKFKFSREDPGKLFYLEFFRPPLPGDNSFYGAGGQDGRFDWTGLDVPAISGMCYTSDHKTWMACGVSADSLIAQGWSIPDFAKNRGVRTGGKMHEIAHAAGVNWHTADNEATPEDDRYKSPMFNYFNFPQESAPFDPWTEGTSRWVRFLPDEWAALEAAGGLT